MAKRTATQKAPEEEPQLAEATKLEVVDITGNVVRAPDLWHTSGGRAICNVRLAVDGDDGQTRWYTVTTWEHLVEAASAHVKKGARLGVRGPLEERRWNGRDGAERTETVVTAWVLHLHRRKSADTTGTGA